MEEYILLKHRNSSVKTISDFISREKLYDNISPDDLFNQNKEYIWSQRTPEYEKRVFGKISKDGEIPNNFTVNSELPCPCCIMVEKKYINPTISISQTNLQTDEDDFYVFENEEISNILKEISISSEKYEKIKPDCTVLGWFKSRYWLSKSNEKITATGLQFEDISDYLISISIRIGEDGGSFTMKLPVIDVSELKVLKKEKYGDKIPESGFGLPIPKLIDSIHGEEFDKNIFDGSGKKKPIIKKTINTSNENYFSRLISSNDLFFISFCKLKENMELNQYSDSSFGKLTSNNSYDMIGLVDSVRTVIENNNAYVEITGRDLMKLIIDDGSFFFMPSICASHTQIFANERGNRSGDFNSATNTSPVNRLRLGTTGQIDIFAFSTNQDISFLIKGILSRLANIEVVPGELFNSWGDKRTKFIDLQPKKIEL